MTKEIFTKASSPAKPANILRQRGIFPLLLALTILVFCPQNATCEVSSFSYDIKLDAPQEIRRLLTENLDLYRWRNHPEMNGSFLRVLTNKTPDRIRELLETEGYYLPEIQASIDDADPLIVRITVKPGQRVRVSSFSLDVHGPFDDGSKRNRDLLRKIREDWSLPKGAPFRHAGWEAAKREALLPLLVERYPTARIAESLALVNPESHEAALSLVMDSGPPYRFGELALEGLMRYPPSVVERLNPARPGEPYSQGKLLDFQSRLRDSPYFAHATVATDLLKETGVADIQVRVEENPAKKFSLGAGVNTDAGPRGSILYGDLNLLERAWRFSATGAADLKRQTMGVDLGFPPGRRHYRDSLHARLERTDIEDQITRTLKLGARRTVPQRTGESTYGVDFTAERIDIAESIKGTQRALTASYGWMHRKTDDPLYPSRGYLFNFQAVGGAEWLLSDRDFLRLHTKGMWFYPILKNGQIVLRGEAGYVWADRRQGIPSDFLFRTGGDQTVRGYGYQSIGVKDGKAVVGGRCLLTAGVEYVHWITPTWGAAAFYDIGDAVDYWSDLDFKRGYGTGVRWKSPVGPLSLDIAYAPDKESVRIHFSVGMVF